MSFSCTVICECGRPPTVANSDISPNQATYTCNSFVDYRCITGYTLEGNQRLQCGTNRAWIGQPPICRVFSKCCSCTKNVLFQTVFSIPSLKCKMDWIAIQVSASHFSCKRDQSHITTVIVLALLKTNERHACVLHW